MKTSALRCITSWVLAALLAACASAPAPSSSLKLTVLHTNDHHGHYWPDTLGQGGLAARKRLVDAVRAEVQAEGGQLLLLDAGDVNTGTPESDLLDAEPDFRGMSLLGYDAMAVGNHEFDRSAEVQQRQRTEWSSFPWLSANVLRDGQPMFEPYRIWQLGGLRVGVLGLTTEDTRRMDVGKRYPGTQFLPAIAVAKDLVPALRRQTDVVIALTHIGHHVDGQHGRDAPDDVQLARAVSGIDLIVGGHTHSLICMAQQTLRREIDATTGPCQPDRQNDTWIVQAGDRGRYLGRADFLWRDGRLELTRYRLLPVVRDKSQAADEDTGMLALLQPFQRRGAAGLLQPLGEAQGLFDGERGAVRHRSTALGRLITAAYREATQADVAILSGGGIRASLPSGTISKRDLLATLPFRNSVVLVSMTGRELASYAQSISGMCAGSGGYPQVDGLSYRREAGSVVDIRVGASPLVPDQRYRLALPSFLAGGGDGYPDLREHPGRVDTGVIDSELLADFIRRTGLVRAEDFRPQDVPTC